MQASKDSNIGTCALCKTPDVKLQDSHLLPKALYKHIRKEDQNNPYIITENMALQTSRQIKHYLLCSDCEDRLNKHGEKWVLAHYNFERGHFPIREALLKVQPIASLSESNSAEIRAYNGASVPDVDIDKLCYFAASVFWRAAAHQWDLLDHNKALSLGPYEEQLRKYLLGEESFPQKACLMIFVDSSDQPIGGTTLPYSEKFDDGYRHRFNIRGVMFDLYLGQSTQRDKRDICAFHSAERPIFLTSAVDDVVKRGISAIAKKHKSN